MQRRLPDLVVSVSVTTRAPRSFERDGIDYRFVSEDEFDRMAGSGELLEWAEIFGHRSGTPAGPVRATMAEGGDVLLELDVQGARQVREVVPEAVLVCSSPLDQDSSAVARPRNRDGGRARRRLSKAEWELGERELFDQVVVNDDAERAAGEVAAIIGASPRHPRKDRPTMIEPKIDELLSQVDSKYTLVTLAAKRAREINSYYNQLGEGRAEFVPPLVESGSATSRCRSPSRSLGG